MFFTPTLTLPLAGRGNPIEPIDTRTPFPCKGEGWVGGKTYKHQLEFSIQKLYQIKNNHNKNMHLLGFVVKMNR